LNRAAVQARADTQCKRIETINNRSLASALAHFQLAVFLLGGFCARRVGAESRNVLLGNEVRRARVTLAGAKLFLPAAEAPKEAVSLPPPHPRLFKH
jgi:hypothetical protein